MEELETHPNPFGKPTEMRHSQKTSLAMGEYPQGILANIQKWDIDAFHYQRTADIGRVSVNPESLHQIASQLREPPYAERHVRWCERSENESRKKTTSFSSYSIISDFQSKITLSIGIGLFIKQLPMAALVTSVSMDDIGITQQGNVLSDHSV